MTPSQRDNLLEAHSQAMMRIAALEAERDQLKTDLILCGTEFAKILNAITAENVHLRKTLADIVPVNTEVVSNLSRENARLRQALEDAPHEYLCLAKWKSHWDTGDWWELKEAQPELCNCWKAALARSSEAGNV